MAPWDRRIVRIARRRDERFAAGQPQRQGSASGAHVQQNDICGSLRDALAGLQRAASSDAKRLREKTEERDDDMRMARRASPHFEKDVIKDKEAELLRLEHCLVHGGADVVKPGRVFVVGQPGRALAGPSSVLEAERLARYLL